MTLPSKELFEAVKGFAVNENTFKVNDKIIHYDYLDHKGQYQHTCTINDFFFEVKDWAISIGYEIWSVLKNGECEAQVESIEYGTVALKKEQTEQEAVTKAAEWILNQQDKGI